jgi:hypothetical protein
VRVRLTSSAVASACAPKSPILLPVTALSPITPQVQQELPQPRHEYESHCGDQALSEHCWTGAPWPVRVHPHRQSDCLHATAFTQHHARRINHNHPATTDAGTNTVVKDALHTISVVRVRLNSSAFASCAMSPSPRFRPDPIEIDGEYVKLDNTDINGRHNQTKNA